VLLACKAYDLDDAMASFAPAVGPDTAILPLLNGIRHLDAERSEHGADRAARGRRLSRRSAVSVALRPISGTGP
jgi:2-dehydropantoate 2-reductase